MNEHSQYRLCHNWLACIATLAFAAVLSPINIHIVLAQEAPQIVVAAADPGEPPAPPQAPATPEVATGVPADVTRIETPVPTESASQTPDVPIAPSEVSSDADIGKLIPNDEPAAQPIANARPKTDPDSVRTLSVEPGLSPILPADRPAWVGAEPDYASAQHFLYVGSLPTMDESDADEALDEPLIAAVRNYIDQEVVNEPGASLMMPVDAEFIRRNLIDNPSGYVCELSTSQGPMFQKWVTVRVTPVQREQFTQWHSEASQRTRLAPLGLGLVSVLALVSLAHMVLRRRHGASPLPSVNQHAAEPVVVVHRSRSWTALKVLGFLVFLMIPALFALAALIFTVRSEARSATGVESHPSDVGVRYNIELPPSHVPRNIQLPDLHKQVRIETLNGEQRTVIFESKSHR